MLRQRPKGLKKAKMFQVLNGSFDEEFYNEFIKHHIKKEGQDLFDDAFKLDEVIQYVVIQLPTRSPVHYHEVLFCDVYTDLCYYPVFMTMINGSSAYAMCRCGMDEEYEPPIEWTTKDILERVKPEWIECVTNFFN